METVGNPLAAVQVYMAGALRMILQAKVAVTAGRLLLEQLTLLPNATRDANALLVIRR